HGRRALQQSRGRAGLGPHRGVLPGTPRRAWPRLARDDLILASSSSRLHVGLGLTGAWGHGPAHLIAAKVESIEPLKMKAEPRQREPSPLGLIAVMFAGLKVAVWSPVSTLQFARDRSVS